MIDFSLCDSQKQLRKSARAFAADVLGGANAVYSKLPTQVERFRSTRSLFQTAVAMGQVKALVPPELGGTGGSMLDVAIILEEMYLVDASVTVTIVGTGLGLTPLILSGNSELQKKYLEPFLKQEGVPLASLMHSEPGGTANWLEKGGKGLQTTARKEGGTWIVNGEKVGVLAKSVTSLLLSLVLALDNQ